MKLITHSPFFDSLLEIDEVIARARCSECNAEFVLDSSVFRCVCGSANLQIVAGNELRIKQLELQNV